MFLALNAACKPFCTEGLSRLNALTLTTQFVTLYGGIVLIVEDFIQKERSASNEPDNTSRIVSAIYGVVYISNAAVCAWPVVQIFLVFDSVQFVQSAMKRFSTRTETKQENETITNQNTLHLDSVSEYGKKTKLNQTCHGNVVSVAEISECQSETLPSPLLHFHFDPDPAVLSNDVQAIHSGLICRRQDAEHKETSQDADNVLVQV